MNGFDDEYRPFNRKDKLQSNRPHHGVTTFDYDDSRDEKPWQRVVYQISRKGKHLHKPVKSVPSATLVLVLGIYLLLAFLTQLVEDNMPSVIDEASMNRDNTFTFSEKTAWLYLNDILGDEPRVAGTTYHLQKTEDLKRLVDNITSQAFLPVRTDWQITTDHYWLDRSYPYVNVYQNASNIIAILEGESGFHNNGTARSSILFNCHYDSVPFAKGASDNAIFCAVLAETLSILSKRQNRFKHNIIFLFNGAEENGLQGSHAFIKHPWAQEVVAVVNLDAAGMNGKPNLFQVTDPRVLRAYARATRKPSAQSFGEYLFSSGIIPSDTDFRIWRDFGPIYGVDVAFVKWGHVYHTRNDDVELVQPGVIQCAGDTITALAAELGDMDELVDKISPESAVYYDFLNTFVVAYTLRTANIVDSLIFIFACVSVLYYLWLVGFRTSTLCELLFATGGRLLCLAAGGGVAVVCIFIMVAANMQLRYLTQPWIVVPLFWMPYLITSFSVSQYHDSWRYRMNGLNRCLRTLQSMAATRLLLALCVLVLLPMSALTTMRYVLSVPLFYMSLTSLFTITIVRYVRLQAWQHLLMELALSLPLVMFLMMLSLRINALLIPIMGRSATDSPDITIGVINLALVVLLSAALSGAELLFSRRRLWMVMSLLGAVCFILMFIPMSPYNDDRPSVQRHYWFHTQITNYNINNEVTSLTSGVFVTKQDAYTIESMKTALAAVSAQRGYSLNTRSDFEEDCIRHVFCNLPAHRRDFEGQINKGLFVEMGPPAAFDPPAAVRLINRTCVGESCTYNMQLIGAPHNMMTIWPIANVNLTSWSFQSDVFPSLQMAGRPVYGIVQSVATYSGVHVPLDFTLTFIVPLSLQSGGIMNFSLFAHKIHHPQDFTADYRNLLEAMPKHFNVATFLTFRNNYLF